MKPAVPYLCVRAKAQLAPLTLCIMLLAAIVGCSHTRRGSAGDGDESLSGYEDDLRAENARLKSRVESQELDLVKLRAEYQRQVDLNGFLQGEIEHLQGELQNVEQQFVRFEQRLHMKETKASAVAAIAESQLLFDKLRTQQSLTLDSLTTVEVTSQLATSDEMVRKKKYAAAVYYAKRAMRALNQAERRRNLRLADGDARIIVVSKANLRTGPGSKYDVITKLVYGTVIVETETSKDWSKVRTQSGITGWIHNSLIR
jgi:hypothetical protein